MFCVAKSRIWTEKDHNGTVRAKITRSAKQSVGLILSIIVTCHRQRLARFDLRISCISRRDVVANGHCQEALQPLLVLLGKPRLMRNNGFTGFMACIPIKMHYLFGWKVEFVREKQRKREREKLCPTNPVRQFINTFRATLYISSYNWGRQIIYKVKTLKNAMINIYWIFPFLFFFYKLFEM